MLEHKKEPRRSELEHLTSTNAKGTIPPVPKWLTPPPLFGTAD